jgi:hypothetical protein
MISGIKQFLSHFIPATKSDIHKLLMKNDELAAKLNTLTTTVGTIGSQFVKAQGEIVTELANLKEAINNADVPEAVTTAVTTLGDAIDKLTPVAQAFDDLNPDVAPPAPPTT